MAYEISELNGIEVEVTSNIWIQKFLDWNEELSTLLSGDAEAFGTSTVEHAAGMVTILVR